jgi:hypothetical protein
MKSVATLGDVHNKRRRRRRMRGRRERREKRERRIREERWKEKEEEEKDRLECCWWQNQGGRRMTCGYYYQGKPVPPIRLGIRQRVYILK